MPRIGRIVVPGIPHHITQRGNDRLVVFFTDDDRLIYLNILREQARKYGLSVEGYCLMTNHIHLVAVPESEESLALAVGRTHYLYTQPINASNQRSGHLWQNRFFSCALDELHMYLGLRYVELNPVRAKMAAEAWDYRWSSAAAHCGEVDATGLLNMNTWRERWNSEAWKKELSDGVSVDQASTIRDSTQTGRPLGSLDFVVSMEKSLGRSLRALPVGRPRTRKPLASDSLLEFG